MNKDEIFQDLTGRVEDFEFDAKVASVFDDMVGRSVPLYAEVQSLVARFGVNSLQNGDVVYDIGCSTGTTLARMLKMVPADSSFSFIGVEPSAPMAQQAKSKLRKLPGGESVQILEKRIEEVQVLDNASLVTMLYTLQFVRPIWRQQVANMIFRSLKDGGMFLLAEKILSDSSLLTRMYIDIYHARKIEAGYTDAEVTRKREALENVLVPFRDSENLLLLERAGFTIVDTAFRWCNFSLYVAVKA